MLGCVAALATLVLVAGTAAGRASDDAAGAPRAHPGASAIAAAFTAGSGMSPESGLLEELQRLVARSVGLSPETELPRLMYASQSRMIALHHREVAGDQVGPLGPSGSQGSEIVALYDDDDGIIYLPEGCTGRTAAEQSTLVHELVHHLQHAAKLRFACPEERETAAFAAQEAWLALLGTTLEREFGLDPFTLLVRTHCPY